jgi:hypothetical protein
MEEHDKYDEYKRSAIDGTLPVDFDEWSIANREGFTVAHVAAQYGHLPADFSQWELADKDGWTVAHMAVRNGHLPANFDQWDLVDSSGVRVSDLAEEQYMEWRIKQEFFNAESESALIL